jgi:MSHA biogenesis protein MshJ
MGLKLPQQLQPLAERIDALELRERVLLLAAVIAVLFFSIDMLALQPALKSQQLTQERIAEQETRLSALRTQARLLQYGGDVDPLQARREQRDELKQKLAELDARIVGQLGALVEPAQAAEVLEQVLARHRGLKLISLHASTRTLDDLEIENGDSSGIGRYQIDLVLDGGYLDVLTYLKALESLPWKFFWQKVDFQSTEYPHATTHLQIYTLGAGHG